MYWLRRVIDAGAIVIVLATAGILISSFFSRQPERAETQADPRQGTYSSLADSGQWVGPEDAPVVIVTYSSYTCGFCKIIDSSFVALRRKYPEHVALVVKHFMEPSNRPESKLPLAAECAADQGRFDSFHRAAFQNAEILQDAGGWRTIGRRAAIPDTLAFHSCVRSQRYQARIEWQVAEARQLGVQGTPTSFVNGTVVVGAVPFSLLDSLVAAHLPRQRPTRDVMPSLRADAGRPIVP